MIGVPISTRLTPPEVAFALALATQRYACKVNLDGTAFRHDSGLTPHYVGVVGELCFRRVHGGRLDTTVRPNGDGHTPDILLPDGRRVEVKSTTFTGRDPALKLKPDEIDTFEYCCLVQVSLLDSAVVYPIWAWDEIRDLMVTRDYGYGPRLVYTPAAAIVKQENARP